MANSPGSTKKVATKKKAEGEAPKAKKAVAKKKAAPRKKAASKKAAPKRAFGRMSPEEAEARTSARDQATLAKIEKSAGKNLVIVESPA